MITYITSTSSASYKQHTVHSVYVGYTVLALYSTGKMCHRRTGWLLYFSEIESSPHTCQRIAAEPQ